MRKTNHPTILSRVPFRLSLGGGSTDLPSYYQKYGGFIFAVTINMYMDVLIKTSLIDDLIHLHYFNHEAATSVSKVKHEIAREALKMSGIKNKLLISFNADTLPGTGLGSSGACAAALLKGLSLYQGRQISNLRTAEQSFILKQNLGLPDGKQDPYVCALGGFVVLDIAKDGKVKVTKPRIKPSTIKKFFRQALFFYTNVQRASRPLLAAQDQVRVLKVKHRTKAIGQEIYRAFLKNDLRAFGDLLNEHWQVKKEMSSKMSNALFDEIYKTAKKAGALGGKILGAGGGGYFMFYCDSDRNCAAVRRALRKFKMQEIYFTLDTKGARAKKLKFD